ncbi:MAG: hypothetical protein ABIS67_08390 [Candidatus Eisenbacteria bacterium]
MFQDGVRLTKYQHGRGVVWFGILTRKSIRRGSFDTVRALVRHITHYIDHWNQDSTPFVWTQEPADIIRKAVPR